MWNYDLINGMCLECFIEKLKQENTQREKMSKFKIGQQVFFMENNKPRQIDKSCGTEEEPCITK